MVFIEVLVLVNCWLFVGCSLIVISLKCGEDVVCVCVCVCWGALDVVTSCEKVSLKVHY